MKKRVVKRYGQGNFLPFKELAGFATISISNPIEEVNSDTKKEESSTEDDTAK